MRGAEVLSPSSQWEVLRFRTKFGVAIVYRNKVGALNANEAARSALGQVASGDNGSLAPHPCAPKAKDRAARRHQLARVIERDGPRCFYCGTDIHQDAPQGSPRHATREHLVPRNQGGPDNVANIFASCEPCNLEAGHMSAPEKIAMRDRKRGVAGSQSAAA